MSFGRICVKSVSFHKKDLSTMKFINISDITHTRLRDARTLEISKARPENQASVSVYHEKMLGGKWHVFEFYHL